MAWREGREWEGGRQGMGEHIGWVGEGGQGLYHLGGEVGVLIRVEMKGFI